MKIIVFCGNGGRDGRMRSVNFGTFWYIDIWKITGLSVGNI